jgi:quercetin dioxygenase-like cupin family protein
VVDERIANLTVRPAVVDGSAYETLTFPTDEIRLRVTDAGDVQVAEYESEDRDGPPAHRHRWHEVEYVIDGVVEFLVDGTWTRCGPGSVQVLPAGSSHSVRVPEGRARLVMVTIGAPYDGFARGLASVHARGGEPQDVVAEANRHGVELG